MSRWGGQRASRAAGSAQRGFEPRACQEETCPSPLGSTTKSRFFFASTDSPPGERAASVPGAKGNDSERSSQGVVCSSVCLHIPRCQKLAAAFHPVAGGTVRQQIREGVRVFVISDLCHWLNVQQKGMWLASG